MDIDAPLSLQQKMLFATVKNWICDCSNYRKLSFAAVPQRPTKWVSLGLFAAVLKNVVTTTAKGIATV